MTRHTARPSESLAMWARRWERRDSSSNGTHSKEFTSDGLNQRVKTKRSWDVTSTIKFDPDQKRDL